MSEKQTVSFLRLLAMATSWRPAKIEVVDLRREVLGELARERLERRRFLRQVRLALLELGDVGIDRDRAAVLGAALADHDPAAVAAPLHLRLAGIAVLRQALGHPFLDPALGILDGALRGRAPDDGLEGHARRHRALVPGVEQPAVAGVAQHEAVLGVVEDEAFRDALDRLDEALLAQPAGVLGHLQRGDIVDPQHALAAGEADVTAMIGDLHVGRARRAFSPRAWIATQRRRSNEPHGAGVQPGACDRRATHVPGV